MSSAVKLTPKARAALQWFRDHEPVAWFDISAPSDAMRRALASRGLIEQLPPENMKMVKWQTSTAGKLALASQ